MDFETGTGEVKTPLRTLIDISGGVVRDGEVSYLFALLMIGDDGRN
jgi:hypothetical protein